MNLWSVSFLAAPPPDKSKDSLPFRLSFLALFHAVSATTSPRPDTFRALFECRRFGDRVSPSSGLEDEVGVGGAFRVLVAGPALPVGVGRSRTLSEGLHHLCWHTEKGEESVKENWSGQRAADVFRAGRISVVTADSDDQGSRRPITDIWDYFQDILVTFCAVTSFGETFCEFPPNQDV